MWRRASSLTWFTKGACHLCSLGSRILTVNRAQGVPGTNATQPLPLADRGETAGLGDRVAWGRSSGRGAARAGQVEGHTADRKGALRHDHSSHYSMLRMTGGKRRAAQGWLGSLSEGLGLGVLFWCCEDALSRLCREGHVQIRDLGGPSGEGLAADAS